MTLIRNRPFLTAFYVVVGVLAIILFSRWQSGYEASAEKSATDYETCVHNQYHTTPAAWMAEHGEYPSC